MVHPSLSPVELDGLGGGRLADLDAGHWQCQQPELRSLDVVDCPRLERLDLSQARPDLHLTLQRCPALEEIRVPPHGTAIVHLDAGDRLPQLRLYGGVEHLDACWKKDHFAVTCHDLAPWQRSVVGSADVIDDAGEGYELKVRLGNARESEETAGTLQITDPQLRTLLVKSSGLLEQIHISAKAWRLEQLFIEEASNLRRIALGRKVFRVAIHTAPLLQSVRGNTDTLRLNAATSTQREVSLDGRHRWVGLTRCRLKQLKMPHPTHLTLEHCRQLQELDVPKNTQVRCIGHIPPALGGRRIGRVQLEERLAMSLAERHRRNDETVLPQLETLLPTLYRRVDASRALRVLCLLLDQGVSPGWIWQRRRELSARHLMPQYGEQCLIPEMALEAADVLWRWDLPYDLHREAWLADYRIWKTCRTSVPEAQRFQRYIIDTARGSLQGPALDTVLESARQPMLAEEDRVLLGRVLLGLSRLARRQASWHVTRVAVGHLRLLERHLDDRDDSFNRALVSYALEGLSLDDFLDMAERIGSGHPRIRQALERVPMKPHHWLILHCGNVVDVDTQTRLERVERLLSGS
ncbi:hypothetical protein [Halomonas ventosae]|uniref:Uncharacterized protein n=1 Tax=Halomonas ventosae TaxID=229007 RepID=A0A2T0VRP8_9GAMM|nr:hypothetical protein [Halomonas ventosae]PRY73214.1 hypothetical protein BCL64_102295 [Halomonas ventosae]